MPTTREQIQSLLKKLQDERAGYVARIEEIDAVFEGLGQGVGGTPAPGLGRKKAAGSGRASTTKPGRKKRGAFKQTGEDSVLGFVTAHPDATAAQVNAHWKKEGRGGSANTALTKLVKAGRLRRKPVKGQRGGVYAAA